ncbi:LLM class flavin-dependent oxidoreductase [Amycolatopsis sp. GM8]|uniref:LLM class flavin-dependent oxidoreductase n=1 Tax=Amycolatopsis sp. GM8 TaxID=2896530 RepID=UPI001F2F3CA9|nr:LLM class flavin-dependent oxidoreductase [Amycolatopsis sp. GM8]
MRIGIHLPITTAEQIQADAATAKGADSLWANQLPGAGDALLGLSAVGGTQELGTAVIPARPRHPAELAAAALTTQALTGGRLTLGIGAGHRAVATDMFGVPYTAPVRHLREYLEVLRPLLRGEHVKHSGEFFTVDTAVTMQAAAPPVLIAALGPRMLEVARDLADGTIATWVRPELVAEYFVPRLREDSRVVVTAMVAVTNDPDGLRDTFARQLEMVGDVPAYRAILDRGGLSGPADTLVAGPEDVVRREIQRFRDAGVTDLVIAPVGDPRHVLDVATS